MLRLRTENDHDLRAVEGSEDIGLVCRAELVLKGYAGKEDLEPLLRELMV